MPNQHISDKAWLELQVISAVSSLKEIEPNHPFVFAIRTILDLAHESGQYEQLELDLPLPGLMREQAD